MADTSTRFAISEPSADRSDAADVPLYIRNIVAGLEALGAQYGQGLLAARPVSTVGSPGKQGRFYFATDNSTLYYDAGTSWTAIGSTAIGAGSVGTTELADNAVTNAKMADNSVGAAEIIDASVGSAEIADALKPSAGAAGGTEALRALGTTAATAAAGNDNRFTQLAGVNAQAGSYTLVLADLAKLISMSCGGNLTVPPNSSVAFPIGAVITPLQSGATQVTIVGGVGVTVHGNPGLKLAGQWAAASLIQIATDVWVLAGNISS
jgi:hypothetical protein